MLDPDPQYGRVIYRDSVIVEYGHGRGRIYATDDVRSGWVSQVDDGELSVHASHYLLDGAWVIAEAGWEIASDQLCGCVRSVPVPIEGLPSCLRRGRMYLTFTPGQTGILLRASLHLCTSVHFSPSLGVVRPLLNDAALYVSAFRLARPLTVDVWRMIKQPLASLDLGACCPSYFDAPTAEYPETHAGEWLPAIPIPPAILREQVITVELRHGAEGTEPEVGGGAGVNFYRCDWTGSEAPFIEYQRDL